MSFERERLETIDSPYAPYKWLTDSNAEPIRRQLELPQRQNVKAGVIEPVSLVLDKNGRVMTLTIKPDTDAAITYAYPADSVEYGLRYIGDARSGRLYPNQYVPSQPENWLRGKRAHISTYRETDDTESFRVLWVEQ